MRHGEAQSVTQDSERPLTTKGQQDACAVGEYLSACQIDISQIMHSPRLRARQTAQCVAKAMPSARVVEATVGLDESDTLEFILDEMPAWHEDTLLVGHLPFLSQLTSQLVLAQPDLPIVSFQPATVICLELHQAQRWIIKGMLTPSWLKPELACDHTQELF